ncbi:erythromycin esterase family protein [Prauserella cavernicola]|uniref:Erythromycin esterase family protein n=1 Tax=Prauserella cavernicola TaxID=2800127 RepID=A0A934QZR1_9PSEU|nr:erythromycin esterase family protein [Prauserella cavernicola]MBK1789047.1 erythromycin esterase family protein [Prauserella cavernicola]
MSQDLRHLSATPGDLLAFGEPAHAEPAFGWIRNELFLGLAGCGFRSIVLETDRVAAFMVDDYVRHGQGDLDTVLRHGFSHGFGQAESNRQLVCRMREYNRCRPAGRRLAFHGFDAPTDLASAPSPLRYLEHARAYLGEELDLAALAGDDERWSRQEAVPNAADSVGATPEASRLRVLADDLLTALHTRAPELIAATSRADWLRARTHLNAGIGLLRYHRTSAEPGEQGARLSRQSAVRDALMARNLLELAEFEARRGPALVFAHNLHLQRNRSSWRLGDLDVSWNGAGSIVAPLLGQRYTFVAGSLGRSDALGLGEPAADTYEGRLQHRDGGWNLVAETAVGPARTRTDLDPGQGYVPLDDATVAGADALLHVPDGAAVAARERVTMR